MNTDYHNPEYIKKQRECKLGNRNPNWKHGKFEGITGKFFVRKTEGKGYNKGERNPMYGARGRERMIKFMTSGKWKNKETSIELKLENELKRQGISYMKQIPLEGIAIVDFLLPNKIIVQADGKYWHSRGKNKGKDIAQDTILGFKSYRIYRFTETEINHSARRCINKIFR